MEITLFLIFLLPLKQENTIFMHQVFENTHTKKKKTQDSDPKWKTVSQFTFNRLLAHCIVDKLGNDPNCGLFAIFDGHGGK